MCYFQLIQYYKKQVSLATAFYWAILIHTHIAFIVPYTCCLPPTEPQGRCWKASVFLKWLLMCWRAGPGPSGEIIRVGDESLACCLEGRLPLIRFLWTTGRSRIKPVVSIEATRFPFFIRSIASYPASYPAALSATCPHRILRSFILAREDKWPFIKRIDFWAGVLWCSYCLVN